jgi:hypothetical protein
MSTAVASKIRQQEKWTSLLYHAQQEGDKAANAAVPTPMIVYSPKVPFFDESPDPSQPVYHVPDGPCGFAWVNLKAAKGPDGKEARQFLNWLLGRTAPAGRGCEPVSLGNYLFPDKKSYYGGYDIWVSGFRQSLQRKGRAADAVAKVLEANVPGLSCWVMDRMD